MRVSLCDSRVLARKRRRRRPTTRASCVANVRKTMPKKPSKGGSSQKNINDEITAATTWLHMAMNNAHFWPKPKATKSAQKMPSKCQAHISQNELLLCCFSF